MAKAADDGKADVATDTVRPRGLEARLRRLRRQRALEAQAQACALEAAGLGVNEFGEETARMQAVLRRLGHLDKENVVQLKGRAAAEVEACDELLAAELLSHSSCFRDSGVLMRRIDSVEIAAY